MCDQRRLWSGCADAQPDQSLRWSHELQETSHLLVSKMRTVKIIRLIWIHWAHKSRKVRLLTARPTWAKGPQWSSGIRRWFLWFVCVLVWRQVNPCGSFSVVCQRKEEKRQESYRGVETEKGWMKRRNRRNNNNMRHSLQQDLTTTLLPTP